MISRLIMLISLTSPNLTSARQCSHPTYILSDMKNSLGTWSNLFDDCTTACLKRKKRPPACKKQFEHLVQSVRRLYYSMSQEKGRPQFFWHSVETASKKKTKKVTAVTHWRLMVCHSYSWQEWKKESMTRTEAKAECRTLIVWLSCVLVVY